MIRKQVALTIILFFLFAQVRSQTLALFEQTSFELNGLIPKDTVTVPLKIDSTINLSDVSVKAIPFIVRLGDKNSESFKDAIRVYKNDSQPIINFIVDMTKLKIPGTYDLTILYKIRNNAEQPLKIFFKRPAAIIDTVSSILINITKWGGSNSYGAFVLDAGKSLSDINEIKFSNPNFTKINKGDIISFRDTLYKIKAGERFKAEYTPNEKLISDLPLGETVGQMKVTSPEMTPVTINFIIIKKLAKPWILVVVLLGLLLGFIVRHFLKDKTEQQEARIKALELMNQIISDTRPISDEPFRKDIAKMLDGLNNVLKTSRGSSYFGPAPEKTLTGKMNETVTSFNDRKNIFQQYYTTQKDSFKELSAGFEYTGLSTSTKKILQPALTFYTNAKTYLEKSNPTAAEQEITNAIFQTNELFKDFTSYYTALAQLMEADSFYPATITANAKLFIKQYLTEIKNQLPFRNSTVTKEVADDVIKADIILDAKDKMMKYLDEVNSTSFQYAPVLNGSTEGQNFDQQLDEWKKTLKNISDNPSDYKDPSQYIAATLISNFNSAWDALQKKQGTGLGDTQKTFLKDEQKTDVKSKIAFTPGEYFDNNTVMADLENNIQRAKSSWRWIACIRTGILLLILSFIVFQSYGASFTGTLSELIAIFLFSFSFDITVENVLQLKDKKLQN